MDMDKATEILKKVTETGQETDLHSRVLYVAIRTCTQKVDVGYYKRVIDSLVAADLLKEVKILDEQGKHINTLYSLTPEGHKAVQELGEKLDKALKDKEMFKGEEHGQA